MKLRIKLKGKLVGIIPIDWTLFSKSVTSTEQPYAQWLTETLWDIPVSNKYIKASLYAVQEKTS